MVERKKSDAPDVHQFKASVKPNIKGHGEYKDFLNKVLFLAIKTIIILNNELSSLKATRHKAEWHYHRE